VADLLLGSSVAPPGGPVAEIDAKWRAAAAATDTIAIRPEAADVGVERLTLVWVQQR
jgi:hypothetical protein